MKIKVKYSQAYTHDERMIENEANTLRYTLPTRVEGLKIKPIQVYTTHEGRMIAN